MQMTEITPIIPSTPSTTPKAPFPIGKIVKYVFIGALILLGLYGAQKVYNLFYENKKLHEELLGQKQKYEQLSQYSAKLEVDYMNQKDLTAKLGKEWEQERTKLEGEIKILAQANFSSQPKPRDTDSSDVVEKDKYVLNEITFNDGPPVGYVLIYKDGKVNSKLYDYQINVNTIVTKDKDSGRYNVASKADYILKEQPKNAKNNDWQNKAFHLPITGGIALVDPVEEITVPTARFYLFAPKLGGGVHWYIDDVVPYVGLSLMGIGQSKRDLSWRFLEFGIEYSKANKLGFSFAPILYRPFPNLLSNTYLSAGMTWVVTGKRYFIGLSVGF